METLANYHKAVLAALTPSSTGGYLHKEVQEKLIVDEERGQYLVMRTGWHNGKNYYGVIQHVEIMNGQVWIHTNNTEHYLEEELVLEGVAREDIIWASISPEDRAEFSSRSDL